MAKRVYIDMDGTLCRFHDAEHKYIEQMWEKGFYIGLKPFEEFVNAISLCIDRNPDTKFYILSAVLDTDPPFAEDEKREWVNHHLPQLSDEHLIFVPAGANKSDYIGEIDKDCYLIDDYNKNLREWSASGGSAIKFINDINNRGLGAYGGEKGMMWDGLSIEYNQSAMAICLQIEEYIGVQLNKENSDRFYGFPDDVSPREFMALIPEYFKVRNSSDIELRNEMYRAGETFVSYSASDNINRIIDRHRANDEFVKDFVRRYDINNSLLNCLECCYITAKAHNLTIEQITNGFATAVSRDNAWSSHPVTPATVQVFISDLVKRESTLESLYSQISAISTQHKKCRRKLFLPTVDDIANNLLSDGGRLQVLNAKNNELKDTLDELKSSWKQLTGEEYPYVPLGKKKQKYTDIKFGTIKLK